MSTTETGRKAEAAAADFLERQGFKILARNWRNRWCEIDLIAERGGTVCFIEVKYRAGERWGNGLDYIGTAKLKQLQLGAEMWTAKYRQSSPIALVGIAVGGPDYNVLAATTLT